MRSTGCTTTPCRWASVTSDGAVEALSAGCGAGRRGTRTFGGAGQAVAATTSVPSPQVEIGAQTSTSPGIPASSAARHLAAADGTATAPSGDVTINSPVVRLVIEALKRAGKPSMTPLSTSSAKAGGVACPGGSRDLWSGPPAAAPGTSSSPSATTWASAGQLNRPPGSRGAGVEHHSTPESLISDNNRHLLVPRQVAPTVVILTVDRRGWCRRGGDGALGATLQTSVSISTRLTPRVPWLPVRRGTVDLGV